MSRLEPATRSVTPEHVEEAADVLRAFLTPTPLQRSRAFSDRTGCDVYLKLESIQPIRAFKVRGALNKLAHMTPEQRAAGVITASAGNHGMGVAYAAATFQAPAIVHVPEGANRLKVEAIKRMGAEVVTAGRNYSAAYAEAVRAQQKSGATFVHAYEDPHVVAGQGTIALELLRDLEQFDTALVAVGGGGLIGGIALYLKAKKPDIRVVGVEPTGADSMRRSLAAGEIVTLEHVQTIADGLAASAPGPLSFDIARRCVDEVVLVEEEEMLDAIRLLFQWEHLLAEPAGAAALAALLRYPREPGERVVVILSGANISDEVMLRALAQR
ncbi:MAG TPA: threonine/serine dehydratase [Candidatus Dormibacteraeota bacterium]